MTTTLASRPHLEQWGIEMPNDQSELFDAESLRTHRLTLVPRHGKDVVGTCPCGRIFTGHSSDAVAEQFRRHYARPCSR